MLKTSSTNVDHVTQNPQEKIPGSIWAIGCAQFLLNASSIMVFGFSAIYLKSVLNVNIAWIGLLEGVVEGTAFAMRLFSGVISDYFRRRKSLMLIGFGLVTIARPLLAISSSFLGVFSARFMDRLGNGIQGTPRDALVGDLAPSSRRGASFGLRQALGSAGSFFGGFLGIFAMIATNSDFHLVFWIATIPAALGFSILLIFVKDAKEILTPFPKKKTLHLKDVKRLPKSFWFMMIIASVFMLARIGEAFLMLHGHSNFGILDANIPYIMIVYNCTYFLISYPIGKLSDRIGRYKILMIGCWLLILSDVVLASASNVWIFFIGVALWGIQMGLTQGMFLSVIADTAPEELRGTSFGIFYIISAVSLVCAGAMAGHVADVFGNYMSFTLSGSITLAALLLMHLLRSRIAPSRNEGK